MFPVFSSCYSLRVLSMYDWGYGPEVLKPASSLQWSPDRLPTSGDELQDTSMAVMGTA